MNRSHWAITKQQMSIDHEITTYSEAINNWQKTYYNDEKDNNNLLRTSIPTWGRTTG